ncbi:MAG: FAD-binding domain-containing protein [Bacteroidota bacterium]|nr:FAD-binding domain-containing protein [Bacteroidota bacterium]
MEVNIDNLIEVISKLDVSAYARTRNFKNGAVSKLSPYISRGVISTKFVLEILLKKENDKKKMEKFFQELVWRDYWQKIWQRNQNLLTDLKYPQHPVKFRSIPKAIVEAETGISAMDECIQEFYETGYIHNHMRMYIAAVCCNIGQYHWLNPAQWMYYNLLDGDWGSNALSWQWVAGTTRQKKYIANQENINKYFSTHDFNTFLNKSYEELYSFNEIPEVLKPTSSLTLKTNLPEKRKLKIDDEKDTYIFNSYNLDPMWSKNKDVNRILLLEPSHFSTYPVSEHVLSFILKMASEIKDIQIAVMEFDQLHELLPPKKEIHYKEHPFSNHYKGVLTERDWIFPNVEATGSFFNYWNKGIKQFKS